MQIKAKEISDKKIWENFILSDKIQGNFLQSWNWGECYKLLGHKIFRFGFWQNNKLIGVVLLIRQDAKRGRYLECPAGPIISWNKIDNFKAFINLIKKIGIEENCSFIRVRPQLENNEKNRRLFTKYGFLKAPMHLHAQDTWVLDVSQSEESILHQMRKTTRYLIRKAMKDGVSIIKSSEENDLKLLYKLQQETAVRHHFVPFSLEFFQAHFQAFTKDNEIKIFKAIYKKQVISIAMIIFYLNRAIYHYSASSSLFNKIPASYLLQWEAIKEAKIRGCRWYDFWGIAPDNNSSTHRFAGVSLFKKGFGGFAVSYLPAHDLPLKWNYWLVYLFETIRRIWRHL